MARWLLVLALVLISASQTFGGQVQHHSRSALNYEPHAEFVSPRFIDVSAGTNSQYKMYVMYWLKKQ